VDGRDCRTMADCFGPLSENHVDQQVGKYNSNSAYAVLTNTEEGC